VNVPEVKTKCRLTPNINYLKDTNKAKNSQVKFETKFVHMITVSSSLILDFATVLTETDKLGSSFIAEPILNIVILNAQS
jgi:hypothetical protein